MALNPLSNTLLTQWKFQKINLDNGLGNKWNYENEFTLGEGGFVSQTHFASTFTSTLTLMSQWDRINNLHLSLIIFYNKFKNFLNSRLIIFTTHLI